MAQPKARYLFRAAQLILFNLFFSTASSAFTEPTLLKEEALEYRQKGYEAQSSGMLADALIFYEKSAQIDPTSAPVYNDLGVVNEMMGQFDTAEEAYLRAVSIDPGYGKAYFNLAQLYEEKGDLPKAGEYWIGLSQLDNQEPSMLKKAGNRVYEIGKLVPGLREKYFEMEVSLLNKKVTAYKKRLAYGDDKELARFYMEKAGSLLKKKDYLRALRISLDAKQLDPENDQLDSLIETAQKKLLLQ